MIYPLIAFIFGLFFGSFANVCIWRLPRDKSIVKPRSFCPNCGKKIPWYYNIPVLSYIYLKGRCAYCREKISIRYPVVELAAGIITASWFIRFDLSITPFIFAVFGIILIIISGIDFEHQYIPPYFSYPLIILGIAAAYYNNFLGNQNYNKFILSLAGAGGGFLIIILIRFMGNIVFKKESMGMGDAKLMAGIGAFVGLGGVFWTIFIGSFLGAIVGLYMRYIGKLEKYEYIPFGPYLSLGSIIFIIFSEFFNSFLTL
ncbi:MAG: prepilin peptidase [Elusimicrobiota bacterium]